MYHATVSEEEFDIQDLLNEEIPQRDYYFLNRAALRDQLAKYWDATGFEEMRHIVRTALSPSHEDVNMPNISGLISNLVAISVNSAEGNVYSGGIQHIDKLIAVKYNKPTPELNIEENDPRSNHILHEFLIGTYLNTFRKDTPNFVYTYNTMECLAPSNPIKGSVNQICKNGEKYAQHIILEYIEGETLGELLPRLSVSELGKIFLCIFCSLEIVNSGIGFNHYDLHAGNIIIRKENRPVSFKYLLPNGETVLVNTQYVPVIVDYGFSRIAVNSSIYSKPYARTYEIINGSPEILKENHPYIDWFKLIANCIYILRQGTQYIHQSFFNDWISILRSKISELDYVRLNAIINLYPLEPVPAVEGMFPMIDPDRYRDFGIPADGLASTYQDFIVSLQKSYYYPLNKENAEFRHSDALEYLLQFRDTVEVSRFKLQSKEEILAKLYPQNRLACNAENGISTDKNGAHRTLFDCAKYFFDSRFNIVEFQPGTTIFHGSANLALYNSEFPLGAEYYNPSTNSSAAKLSVEDSRALKNGGSSLQEIQRILDSTQQINLSFYGDLDIAQAYSQMPGQSGFQCGDKCTHAYTVKKEMPLLNLSDFQTLRALVDVLSLKYQFLFTLYHGQDYLYKSRHVYTHDTNTLNEILVEIGDNFTESNRHFRKYISDRVEQWKSRFFDSLGLMPEQFEQMFIHALTTGIVFRLPDFRNRSKIIVLEKGSPWIKNVIDILKGPDSEIRSSFKKEISRTLQVWSKQYGNVPVYDRQVNDLLTYTQYHPMKRMMFVGGMNRTSMRFPDYIIPKILMEYCEKHGYAGYAYLPTGNNNGGQRFGEIVLGKKVKSYLKRDYNNPYDWQYNDDIYIFGEIGRLIQDMKRYETTNIDFHSGDLYEHSVWTALYIQWMFKTNHQAIANISGVLSYRKILIAAAFLHDIGKGGDHIFLYYDKSDHPQRGQDYFTNGYTDSEQKIINLNKVLMEMGIAPEDHSIVRFLIRWHWDIGHIIREVRAEGIPVGEFDSRLADRVAREFNRMCAESEINISGSKKVILFVCLYAIWSADVMASQPFISRAKLSELTQKITQKTSLAGFYFNEYLEEFPYIANVPKIHRGGDKYRQFQIQNQNPSTGEYVNSGLGITLRKNVIARLYDDGPD